MSSSKLDVEKRAPVQGLTGGIPWSMHLKAYDAYCERYGAQAALIDLEGRNCRGGFGVKELDMFIPGWRDELSELTALKKRIADLEAERKALVEQVKRILSADREALADHRPKWGLADCVDNDGVPYQSAGLGEALATLRALVEGQS